MKSFFGGDIVAQELRCRIVCGGANNQLEREEVGNVLLNQGIVYAPDYVANAGGLISEGRNFVANMLAEYDIIYL